jgi:predicted MFS family arabinose efflux permease
VTQPVNRDTEQSVQDEAAARRTLWLLIAAIFVVSIDSRVISPILPAIASEFDVSIGQAGWIVTAYLLPYGLFQLAYGPMADRVGQVRVVSVALGAFAAGGVLCALAPSLNALVGARLFTGLAAAAVFPLTLAYIGETVEYTRRQNVIGYTVMASAVGQVMSAAVGGFLAAVLTWRAIFLFDGLVAAAITLVLLQRLRSTPKATRPRRRAWAAYAEVLSDRRHARFYTLIFVEGGFTIGAFSFFGALLRDRDGLSYSTIGALVALFGVTSIVAGRFIGPIARRYGEQRMIAVGGMLSAACFVLVVLRPTLLYFPIAMLVLGAAFIVMHSTFQTRATELAPDARATGIALFAFSLFLGSSLGALLVAQSIDRYGYHPTMLGLGAVTALFTVVATFGVIPWSQPVQGRSEPQT